MSRPWTDPALRALVDRIVPADEFPSGWDAGVGTFIERMLTGDLADRSGVVEDGLALLGAEAHRRHGRPFDALDPASADALIGDLLDGGAVERAVDARRFLGLMVDLTVQGFYGDPGNGGNRDGVAWRMVGYREVPSEATWPEEVRIDPPVTRWEAVRDRYDAVVVGSGAGGGIAARVLAEAGLHVLLVERGRVLPAERLRPDHLRSQRLQLGYASIADPPAPDHPRVFAGADGDVVVDHTDARWQNTAVALGGGTRVYGAQAWRLCEEDFRMASTYGVPDGSSLADWPIDAADLEQDYDRAEWELGVSGDPVGNAYAGRRSRDYPMPPLSPGADAVRLRAGADSLGLATSPVPLLINSVPYNGRGACIRCGACVGFACPGEFKTDSRNEGVARAVATGRCDLLVETQATRIRTDEDGRVVGVELAIERDGRVLTRYVEADRVLLGAGAVETARLLLASPSAREPHGLGNGADQVGRHLQGHVYAGAVAVFDEPVQLSNGPGPGVATNDFRHHNPGLIGGAMIANDFVPMPLFVHALLVRLGAAPAWGAAGKRAMRHLYPRLALVMGPVQEVPNPESRVTLDPHVRDRFGVPVARLSGAVHPEDARTAAFISERAVEWAVASGATTTHAMLGVPADGPSGGQHQAGTCRMGDDPASSVTDEWGTVWGHDNLHVVDGSLHVTNGGVNPVLTILALAYRVSRHVVASPR